MLLASLGKILEVSWLFKNCQETFKTLKRKHSNMNYFPLCTGFSYLPRHFLSFFQVLLVTNEVQTLL